MRVLFVHGRSQEHNNPETLKAKWLEALNNGLNKAGLALPAGVVFDFPFYGDRLDHFVRQFELPADPAIAPKGSPAFDEYAEFRRQIANEMRLRVGISDAEVQAQLGSAPAEKGLQNWKWVQAIVRLIDRRITTISQGTIEVFMRDVFLYTQRDSVRNAIDSIVADLLAQETSVVVGHSLGSVVAYNVLKARFTPLPAYVTVGSPLAIRAIRKSVTPISNPFGINGWYNAYDPRDIVSLYPLDTNNFDVDPSIINIGTVNNYTDNRHGITGYLDDANVAKAIWLGLHRV
ncbi:MULTISPECIES: hypothetical protein [unclassified Bradyrhizobium]|uniref:hypothetical protein n=1 Tax=unclassified Bradyrhizobium TaxID=2631580 RepID=UPI0023428D77|nr:MULTISPECIES: hypothetical protein [unclassified Bradyrhizobium]GLH78109.1 hypothetical protein SSBR45G_30170 [Bradyrhizobium sp. SSBR45G]GLH88007.1 hypothetical protein SSBR45R_54670 [Bradyrhizobium sp. SSBR45R]